jgi:hypothetical protein
MVYDASCWPTNALGSQEFLKGFFDGPPSSDCSHGDWSIELQVRAGVVPRVELGIKASRIYLEDGYEFIAFDPKVALIPNHVAFSMPIGTFTGQEIDEKLQLHPTLILSTPVNNGRTEITGAAKAVILFDSFSGDLDNPSTKTLWGFNFGVRFNSESARWAVHPEVGFLIDDEEATSWAQAGIGVWLKTKGKPQP